MNSICQSYFVRLRESALRNGWRRTFQRGKSGGKSGSSKAWIQRHLRDPYVKQAERDNFRSRAAFKFLELQQKYNICSRYDRVIDLGAAPGGWSQAVAKNLQLESSSTKQREHDNAIGQSLRRVSAQAEISVSDSSPEVRPTRTEPQRRGILISIDLLHMEPIDGGFFIQGDFQDPSVQKHISSILADHGSNSTSMLRHNTETSQADVILSDMLHNTTGHSDTDHYRSIELCTEALNFSESILRPGGNFLCKFLRGSDDKELMDEAKRIYKKVVFVKPKSSRNESREMYMLAQQRR